MHIKLPLPQATWLSIYILKGPELKTHYYEDREEKRAHHPAGFEPTTSLPLYYNRCQARERNIKIYF